jgi:hypothetical protein
MSPLLGRARLLPSRRSLEYRLRTGLGGPRGGPRLGFGEPSGVALNARRVLGRAECWAQQELRPPTMRLGRARQYVRSPSGQETVAVCVWFVPRECLRFRPEGSVSGSPGRSPGSGAVGFRSGMGFPVLTHLAVLRSALQAWGVPWGPCVGLGGLVSVVQLTCCCDSGLRGRFLVALFTKI